MALALAVCALVLAGVGITVQLLVYPAFAVIPAAAWQAHHDRHSAAITRVVAVPWAVQGVATVGLIVTRYADPLTWVAAVASAVTVAATVGLAVPVHQQLRQPPTAEQLHRLLLANLVRTIAWAVAAGAALAAIATHS